MERLIRGFTLIEAMIVVAIIGIIVAFGYPAYRDQVMKSRRAEGMGELLELADRLERYYSDKGTYDGVTAADIFHTDTAKGYYMLAIVDAETDNMQFAVTATPKNGQEKDKCHTFKLTSQGTKSVSGGSLGTEDCWK
jgi:type IV pilus assembly protein PilE